MSSTGSFVALVGFAVGAMTVWILLDWLQRVNERPFRPRGYAIESKRAHRGASEQVQADAGATKVRSIPERSSSGPTLSRGNEGPNEVPAGEELDFDYIDTLRTPAHVDRPSVAHDSTERDELVGAPDHRDEESAASRQPQTES
ncbi:MAG: hypothetical protein IH940_05410 [Acidobacteria bacterium]|nr:hypothetical protein [Acidobacteriota bacterium]